MYKYVFEDKENTPSSILLKNCINGSNMYFSAGCSKMFDTIKILSDKYKDDIIIAYYDVSPNNNETIIGYEELKENLYTYNITNVEVIPYICIEQTIAIMLSRYNYLSKQSKKAQNILDNIVKIFDWSKVQDNIKYSDAQKSNKRTLEQIYKLFLNEQWQICVHNTHKSNILFGKFYTDDCSCPREHCKISIVSSLKFKAEQLYTSLPLFTCNKQYINMLRNNYGINIAKWVNKINSIEDVKISQQKYYDKLCANMRANGEQVETIGIYEEVQKI